MHYAVFSRVGYYSSMHNAVLTGSGDYLYYAYVVFGGGGYALQSIFGEWRLFILCTTQYFRGVDYNLYYVLRSIFEGRILFILCTTQYFRGVDTIHTMHFVVFQRSGFYLYYVLRSIFEE